MGRLMLLSLLSLLALISPPSTWLVLLRCLLPPLLIMSVPLLVVGAPLIIMPARALVIIMPAKSLPLLFFRLPRGPCLSAGGRLDGRWRLAGRRGLNGRRGRHCSGSRGRRVGRRSQAGLMVISPALVVVASAAPGAISSPRVAAPAPMVMSAPAAVASGLFFLVLVLVCCGYRRCRRCLYIHNLWLGGGKEGGRERRPRGGRRGGR